MTDNPLRIVFMGTPDFAVPALQALLGSKHEVIAVYSQPPRPKGRGHQVQLSPVHQRAQDQDIPVYNPLSLKKDIQAQAGFAALDADVAVVAAYGLILPQAVLEAPRFGCLNIHASLLPRWRGASPIQHAIWKGDAESGVTIMQMEQGLDTGPMISKKAVPIRPQTSAQSLHDELSALGAAMCVDVIDRLAAEGGIEAEAQDDTLSTYAPLLKKEDGRVDWTNTAQQIDCQIRALNPWPGVWAQTDNGRRIKILEAVPVDETFTAPPGTITDHRGHVSCGGDTGLLLQKVQPENSKPMDAVSAINGGHLKIDHVLG
ncbi:MAG: methionyl-tRNA formyltransferase [Rhodospirillales bacterium]|nr:methionyl-tRNA formyltransferase [Rhodospirillales bacterium]MCB9997270.1 methionyl-tRNA formyltransferase [Rhodospirillales bacterium]